MALPMIAAGLVARAAAKKLASRAAGGIAGKGAKSVNPMYKMMDKQVTPLSKSVKVNSNPNKTPTKGERNPTKQMLDEYKMDKELYKKGLGSNPKIKKQTVKINSAIPKRGK